MRPSPLPRRLLPAVLVAAVALALTGSAGAQQRPATGAGADDHDHHEHAALARLVEPMGAATLVLLVATAVTGGLIRRKRRPLLTLHKVLGTLTLLSAVCHGVLVAVTG
jgi:hypothetical protein